MGPDLESRIGVSGRVNGVHARGLGVVQEGLGLGSIQAVDSGLRTPTNGVSRSRPHRVPGTRRKRVSDTHPSGPGDPTQNGYPTPNPAGYPIPNPFWTLATGGRTPVLGTHEPNPKRVPRTQPTRKQGPNRGGSRIPTQRVPGTPPKPGTLEPPFRITQGSIHEIHQPWEGAPCLRGSRVRHKGFGFEARLNPCRSCCGGMLVWVREGLACERLRGFARVGSIEPSRLLSQE